MTEIIIISVSLIFFLILIQRLTLYLNFHGGLLIKIDYSLITLILQSGGKSDSKAKRQKRKRRKRTLELISALKASLPYLIKSSDIELERLDIKAQDDKPHKFVVKYKTLTSLFSVIPPLASDKAKSFTFYSDTPTFSSDQSEPIILEISFSLRLYKLFVFLVIFSARFGKNILKRKIKRGAA